MALYYRFRSAKQFSQFPIFDRFISIGEFKDRIFESKIGNGRDFDLVISDAETNLDYLDESTLIPVNTRLLIRRIPGWPRKPIVVVDDPVRDEPKLKECDQDTVKPKANPVFIQDSDEWDEFFAANSGSSSSSTLTTVDVDGEIKIQASSLESRQETVFNSSCGSGAGGRITGRNIPPEGYVCRRCKVAGHFIQHCPTNGDPEYDVKEVKAPKGIPKSMLIAAPDGKVAVLSPDDATFQKQVEGMPSTGQHSVSVADELHCKLCKKIMEYAVMTSKCCFDSFCDQCIRNYIISNSMCVCGAKSVLTDHLIPNLTLRNAINRIMESNNDDIHASQIQHKDSINPQAKVPSLGQSLANSNSEAKVPTPAQSVVLSAKEEKDAVTSTKEASESEASKNDGEVVEATEDPLDVGQMHWRTAQNLAAENYMMSMAFAGYNPYWNWNAGIQPGMEGVMTPAGSYAGVVPYTSYGVGPLNMSYGGFLPQEQCSGPPMMSRELEAAPKRKHDREVHRRDISSKKFKTNHHRWSGY